jgi:hypothetical protein
MLAYEVLIEEQQRQTSLRITGSQTIIFNENIDNISVQLSTDSVSVESRASNALVRDFVSEVTVDTDYRIPDQRPPPPNIIFTATAGESLEVGMPVYMSNGILRKAYSISDPFSDVVGIIVSGAAVGDTAGYTTDGAIQRSDWTSISGSARLEVGATYYLSAIPGRITKVPPLSGVSLVLGRAVYDTLLDIEIGQQIQLA